MKETWKWVVLGAAAVLVVGIVIALVWPETDAGMATGAGAMAAAAVVAAQRRQAARNAAEAAAGDAEAAADTITTLVDEAKDKMKENEVETPGLSDEEKAKLGGELLGD